MPARRASARPSFITSPASPWRRPRRRCRNAADSTSSSPPMRRNGWTSRTSSSTRGATAATCAWRCGCSLRRAGCGSGSSATAGWCRTRSRRKAGRPCRGRRRSTARPSRFCPRRCSWRMRCSADRTTPSFPRCRISSPKPAAAGTSPRRWIRWPRRSPTRCGVISTACWWVRSWSSSPGRASWPGWSRDRWRSRSSAATPP